jgi:hypothetical protein
MWSKLVFLVVILIFGLVAVMIALPDPGPETSAPGTEARERVTLVPASPATVQPTPTAVTPTEVGSEPAPDYAAFSTALQVGANCQDLFEIRNTADPKSASIERMNEDLRSVGCFFSSSTRITQEQADAKPAPGDPSFTVMEYRLTEP